MNCGLCHAVEHFGGRPNKRRSQPALPQSVIPTPFSWATVITLRRCKPLHATGVLHTRTWSNITGNPPLRRMQRHHDLTTRFAKHISLHCITRLSSSFRALHPTTSPTDLLLSNALITLTVTGSCDSPYHYQYFSYRPTE